MFEFPAMLTFLPLLIFIFPTLFFGKPGKHHRTVFGPDAEIKLICLKLAQFPREKRVRVPNQGRGSDLDRSADLESFENDFFLRNWEPNFEF